ncbi:hypothetical protein R1flu_024853 [Riccia fluitans]|uniref:E3 ubiquitin-protein ligase listerin n=1 Tax=Riccia fluitans TaxID=41844 RepID=A0ABD1XW29_9MARC
MGRNKGDPARSKARPSSSSFAASLLQSPVATAVGFGGYVGSSRVDTGPSGDGELLMDVDGEASLHLKRLSKKDSTTKLKALTALTTLFKERSSAELSALLPSWVFEYKRLVQDCSRQVRESSHIAMCALVNSVGRGIAPHLRSLMGPWWVAQFDPSREVSEAAKSSFQMAFSGQKKRLEALIYCGNEIFIYLDDNLKLTPQTISDKTTPIEESIEKHERVVSCSLLALAAIIDILVGSLKTGPAATSLIDAEVATKTTVMVTEAATNLCWNHKYMREYMRSKSSRIRSAVYQALRAYIQHIPKVFKVADMESVSPQILGAFAEKDAACHQPMWDMILLFAQGFPDSWDASTMKKVVFLRFFSYLRHSCYGSELLSYPSLLPLLSLIPPKSIAPSQSFLLDFFSNFWRGRPASKLGSTYWLAFLNAIRECFIWAVKNAKRFAEADRSDILEFQIALIDGVLLKLLWYDYIGSSASQATQLTVSTTLTSSEDGVSVEFKQTASTKAAERSSAEGKSLSSSTVTNEDYFRDICACIVDAIESLSGGESGLLDTFWTEFQSNCLSIVQDSGRRWLSDRDKDTRISRIADFFVMLGSKSLKSGSRDRWVVPTAVRPFISRAFPIIKSAGDPESVRLLAKLTSVYGPTIFLRLTVTPTEGLKAKPDEEENPEHSKLLLKYFKEDIVPWYLDADDELSGPKAELILAFIQSPSFEEQWDFVIAHITEGLHEMHSEADLKAVGVLAVLLEKVRETGMTSGKERLGNQRKDVTPVWWKSNRIDHAALRVASSCFLSKPASFRLVRSVLGGISSGDLVPDCVVDKAAMRGERSPNLTQNVTTIVSDGAAREIFQILLKRILSVSALAEANWVKHSPSLFIDKQDIGELPEDQQLTKELLELAATAIDIISECILCLPSLDRDSTVVGKLVAALFCLRWGSPRLEDRPVEEEDFDSDLESEEDVASEDGSILIEEAEALSVRRDVDDALEAGVDERSIELEQGWKLLMGSVRNVQNKLSPSFCNSFSALTRFRVRQILIQCLRNAVFDETFDSVPHISVKVATWTKEILTFTCENADEASELLDSLLSPSDDWPLWVEVPTSLKIKAESNQPSCRLPGILLEDQKARHGRFVSFVDMLSKTLSPREVFLGPSIPFTHEKQDEPSMPGVTDSSSQPCRTWLVVELLCTWQWPGGSVLNSHSVLAFLCSLSRSNRQSSDSFLLWNVIETLFMGASQAASHDSSADFRPGFSPLENDKKSMEEPFLRALLKLLRSLLEMEDGWSKADTRKLFRELVTNHDSVNFVSSVCDIRILPSILSVLMPALRKKTGIIEDTDGGVEEEWQLLLKNAVCEWLLLAKATAPLVAHDDLSIDSGIKWIPVAVACFPVNSAGGAAAMAAALALQVSPEEKALLLQLLQKQFSREAIAAVAGAAALRRSTPEQEASYKKKRQIVELTLAKLVAAATAYGWFSFGVDEWEFILSRLRSWMEDAVVDAEDFTENISSVVEKESERAELGTDQVVEELESIVKEKDGVSIELSSAAVAVFSLLRGMEQLEGAESSEALAHLQTANWKNLEVRALEDVLRLLLAIGLAESIAANSRAAADKTRSVIASWRKLQGQLWDNAAEVALSASNQAREAAIRAVDLWGIGKGAISALYALLFSPQPTMSLQWVAYNFLTSGHVLEMAITCGVMSSPEGESKADEEVGDVSQEALTAVVAQIRPELTSILNTIPSVILFQPLTSSLRVRYLLGWSLYLTRLSSLPSSSSTRERLVQYVQDSDTSATLLDFLFQHIPLEQNVGSSGSRRKSTGISTKTSIATAATRAAATGSVAFAVEGLWPVQKESIVTLAGAVYGLMLLVLPACVRIWFTGLRDKALASAIEAFTTTHCSPQLLFDEFAKVQESAARAQEAGIDEEEFTIRANRGLREVTAVYKKEEAGMDIVIRMPACYPLRAVGVECTRRMGIDETLLRKWILSMAAFLRNQNGAVSEAIQMWKRNVDREFEGVEPCPICYSIIHTSNHSLPRLACKTCSNKFHSACLYKWFSTSHQSTCPLCKTPF